MSNSPARVSGRRIANSGDPHRIVILTRKKPQMLTENGLAKHIANLPPQKRLTSDESDNFSQPCAPFRGA